MTHSSKEGLLFAALILLALFGMFAIERLVINAEAEMQAKCNAKQGVLTYTNTSGYRCVHLKANQ